MTSVRPFPGLNECGIQHENSNTKETSSENPAPIATVTVVICEQANNGYWLVVIGQSIVNNNTFQLSEGMSSNVL